MTTRYLICGSRKEADKALVWKALAAIILHPEDAIIIHGDARPPEGKGESYDRLAGEWGIAHGAKVIPVPADWDAYGRAAGPIRNGTMIAEHEPDVCIHFPGADGTADMIRQARKAGLLMVAVTA